MIPAPAAQRLRDRAHNAPVAWRVLFDAFSRKQEIQNPNLLVQPEWPAFVGVASLAGCFSLCLCLAHEAPEHMRTELESEMKIELSKHYPDCVSFWDDIARFTSDSLLEIPRPERGKYLFLLPAMWVVAHITQNQEFEGKDVFCGELAMILQSESIGYWRAVQDYSEN